MNSLHLNTREVRLGVLERAIDGDYKNKASESVALASTHLAVAYMGEA